MLRAMAILGLLAMGCADETTSGTDVRAGFPECQSDVTSQMIGTVTYCVSCRGTECNTCAGVECYSHDAEGRYFIQLKTPPSSGECVISIPDGTGVQEHVLASGLCP